MIHEFVGCKLMHCQVSYFRYMYHALSLEDMIHIMRRYRIQSFYPTPSDKKRTLNEKRMPRGLFSSRAFPEQPVSGIHLPPRQAIFPGIDGP